MVWSRFTGEGYFQNNLKNNLKNNLTSRFAYAILNSINSNGAEGSSLGAFVFSKRLFKRIGSSRILCYAKIVFIAMALWRNPQRHIYSQTT